VLRGVAAIQTKITLIHDAARPLLYAPALKDCLEKLQNGARIVHTATHPYASMLLTTDGGPVKGVIERNEIAYGMCPAAFYTEDLRDAFRMAAERGLSYRDEAAMMHALRPDIVMETVPGHRSGFKLTYAEDMEMLTVYRRHLDS
nr:2-C-methyl-D-erythritol 4-phosphate cytidylyltransferase [Acidimicrobiia bacterium]